MLYKEALKESMQWLSRQPKTIFIGQSVAAGGTFMSQTFEGVPELKRIEFPVTESFQLQFSIGLALGGYNVISVYPRQNFLLLALADLVLTLDKIPEITHGAVIPKVIIRTASGPDRPIFPQKQHIGDYSHAIESMLPNFEVFRINKADEALDIYKSAYKSRYSCIVFENGNKYEN